MATLLSSIETQVRRHLDETSSFYWTSPELVDIFAKGCIDLWRSIVDLKAEHYLVVDEDHVSIAANSGMLTGVPTSVHKVYLIEPITDSSASVNRGVTFTPMDYNDPVFRAARAAPNVDPSNVNLYYAITGQGAPVNAPVIYIAPKLSSAMHVRFCYVPVLSTGSLTATDQVPIPGEADNALIAWGIAYARAKEREDRAPDPEWLGTYGTEKQHLLASLGLRQLQEPEFVKGLFEEYW